MLGRNEFLFTFCVIFLVITVSAQTQFTYPGKTNPHGPGISTESNCSECHSAEAIDARIHPMFNLNTKSPRIAVPKEFPLTDDTGMNCLTCHLVTDGQKRSNRSLLRGGPYSTELDFCYNCHLEKDYKKVNPHQQLREDGSVDSGVCLHCHAHQPSATDHPTIAAEMHMEMKATCNKCHALNTHEQNHYGKSLLKSKRATLEQFKLTEELHNIKIPLSSDSLIECHTCHYIHGSLGIDAVVYEGSEDNQYFLRLPKEQLCYACHNL